MKTSLEKWPIQRCLFAVQLNRYKFMTRHNTERVLMQIFAIIAVIHHHWVDDFSFLQMTVPASISKYMAYLQIAAVQL